MRRRTKARRQNRHKAKLGLPDLEHVKSAVLVSLRSPESQRSYRRSIDDFVCWYCSEPRLSFNKTVVTRYRVHLEDRLLAPGTINVRLAAVRRLAYEAADTGLLSPDLAAGIRRVKGAKKLGMRLGNWLTVEEARALWQLRPDGENSTSKLSRSGRCPRESCGSCLRCFRCSNLWTLLLTPNFSFILCLRSRDGGDRVTRPMLHFTANCRNRVEGPRTPFVRLADFHGASVASGVDFRLNVFGTRWYTKQEHAEILRCAKRPAK
jgi:hypothetical protein